MSQGTRRLAAIMFTDMVGYASLAQRNESISLTMVDEQRQVIRPILSRHSGREVKTMGDAFLVEFPSALDAVRCAYDIQRAIRELDYSLPEGRRIQLRVGIHLGDVVESQGDISGDAVNVASRIEPLAEVGGVCMTRQVYDQVQNKFELPLVSVGSKILKSLSTPVEVYKVVLPWDKSEGSELSTTVLDRKRIAILPFANFSPDPTDGYLADGMTEEIITRVSRVPELSVISRTSVMGYRNKDRRASEIANELKVGTLLEGSVRKAGNRVRITVQLVDAGSDRHLWAESFDRDLEDIFAVQTEVAEKVASSLQIKLTDEDRERIEKGGTQSVEAHTLYLKGKANLWRMDEGSLRTAIGCFEKALALDPRYVLAYCSLSTAYSSLAGLELLPPEEAYQNAETYARKALELDRGVAEAHAALAGPLMNSYDFKGAVAELEKAIELSPSLSEAYFWLPGLYILQGRMRDAQEAIDRELRLDPLSVHTSGSAGTWCLILGEYEKAATLLKDAYELDPSASLYLDNLGMVHIQQGLLEQGLAEVKRAMEMGGSFQTDLAYAYVKAGKHEEARRLLEALQKPGGDGHVRSTILAGVHAVLGDKEAALEWLERAYGERAGYLPWTTVDPAFDNIRGEPRYLALVRKMGLSQPSPAVPQE
ncbi:MAG: tetratricopeptide repeat protein [Thaumarchaeota archaeon]|nr:tetratricopeptide repeat protein [Nitrososphaerota archaeon]